MRLPPYVSKLLFHLESSGFEAFVVGGCVRDSLLGLEPHDWDICTAARPEDVLACLDGFAVIPTGLAHGTVTVVLDGYAAEVTTFRSDGRYLDGRHPEDVTFLPSVEGDLSRRDFTINAMAYSPKSGLIDLFHGQEDLAQHILRCVGDAGRRFEEDALRIMRALRFAAVYNLALASGTARAIHEKKSRLTAVAAERIWVELSRLLQASRPGGVLTDYPDILAGLLFPGQPGLLEGAGFRPPLWKSLMDAMDTLPAVPAVRLTALLYAYTLSYPGSSPDWSRLLRSLKLDNHTRRRTLRLIEAQGLPLPDSLAAARRMTGALGRDGFSDYLGWREARHKFWLDQAESADDMRLKRARQYMQDIAEGDLCCSIPELAVTGTDLIACGMAPGPEIGQTLQLLLELVIDGKLPNEKKALLNHLFS